MYNCTTKQTGDKLTIEINLTEDHGASASGKTRMIASTQGNQTVGTLKDGKPIIMGLNIYTK